MAAPRSMMTASKTINHTPPLTIAPSAIVADKASITGTHRITIHANAIIHPFARLDSSVCELEIGESCTVWEKAAIGFPAGQDDSSNGSSDGGLFKTTISPYCSLSPHSTVSAGATIGVHSSIEVGASVGSGCVLGLHCRLTPTTSVEAGATLDDYTVLFFVNGEQRQRTNVSARDFEQVRDLEAKGRERERELVGKVVRGSAAAGKWQ